MRFLLLLGALGSMQAQSLQILPSPPANHGIASFRIMLASPAGREPVALQWKLWFPEGVTVALGDIVAGSAAESAGKALTCSALSAGKAAEKGSVYGCILAGGVKPIPNGPAAVVRCTIRTPEVAVRIRGALAVAPDLKRIDLKDSEATIRTK
jgi:hypothetical protein